jgi:glycosyltransferase involved in cell wall biosynthesis
MVLCASPSSVCALLQCTNLGGMEQCSYFVCEQLNFDWRVATPRTFGPGERRIRGFDPSAVDNSYRGKFGVISQAAFESKVHERSAGASVCWVTGTDVACLRAASKTSLPIVLSHHYHHFENGRGWIKWKLFYELLVRGETEVVYATDFTRNEAMSICPWLKQSSSVVRSHFPTFDVASNDRAAAKAALGLDADTFLIGNAGWLIPRKRWDVFLETAARVAGRLPQARFIICGGGSLETELKQQAAQFGIADKVRFCGWVGDLAPYYRAFDVLLFNSDFDALGRTPGEAMGYGVVPVCSVGYGGLPELVEHERNGFLIDRHDATRLADFIVGLQGSRDMREQLVAAGRQTLGAKYSKEAAIGFYRDRFAN